MPAERRRSLGVRLQRDGRAVGQSFPPSFSWRGHPSGARWCRTQGIVERHTPVLEQSQTSMVTWDCLFGQRHARGFRKGDRSISIFNDPGSNQDVLHGGTRCAGSDVVEVDESFLRSPPQQASTFSVRQLTRRRSSASGETMFPLSSTRLLAV